MMVIIILPEECYAMNNFEKKAPITESGENQETPALMEWKYIKIFFCTNL